MFCNSCKRQITSKCARFSHLALCMTLILFFLFYFFRGILPWRLERWGSQHLWDLQQENQKHGPCHYGCLHHKHHAGCQEQGLPSLKNVPQFLYPVCHIFTEESPYLHFSFRIMKDLRISTLLSSWPCKTLRSSFQLISMPSLCAKWRPMKLSISWCSRSLGIMEFCNCLLTFFEHKMQLFPLCLVTSHHCISLPNSRFASIQHRPGVRVVISEKFVEIFNWYETDLDEIQQIYEKHKVNYLLMYCHYPWGSWSPVRLIYSPSSFQDDPRLMRNAPPVAGAISWSRHLMKRIEDPMKVFRENKAVTNLKDFSRIVKLYNRLAMALVTFESLWFNHWKQGIEHAKSGLCATLFVHHPETKEIMVNADEKYVTPMQDLPSILCYALDHFNLICLKGFWNWYMKLSGWPAWASKSLNLLSKSCSRRLASKDTATTWISASKSIVKSVNPFHLRWLTSSNLMWMCACKIFNQDWVPWLGTAWTLVCADT